MLEKKIRQHLQKLNIVLASSSPSRREVFEKNMKLNVEIWPPSSDYGTAPDFKVKLENDLERELEAIALKKVEDVEQRLHVYKKCPDMFIGSHTVVVHNKKVLQKPETPQQAYDMLTSLAGCSPNSVYTSVAIKAKDKKIKTFTEKTLVYFGENINAEQINMYIDSGEPMDKAGAYGIQGYGSGLVERIDGNYFNIMGIPVFQLCQVLNQMFAEDVEITQK